MRKILLSIFFLFSIHFAYAQKSTQSILFLKNGYSVKGSVENKDADSIKIRSIDGTLFTYSMNDIVEIQEGIKIKNKTLLKGRISLVGGTLLTRVSSARSYQNISPSFEIGPTFGLMSDIYLNSTLFLRTGFFYEDKVSSGIVENSFTQRFGARYITLPVKLAYEFGGKIKFNTNAGGTISYNFNRFQIDEKIDLCASAGIGIIIPISSSVNVSIDGFYNRSLSPLVTRDEFWLYYLNNTIGTVVGLSFKL